MDRRTERVTLETDRYRVSGDLTLPRTGYRSRLSDYLNRSDDDFVALSDAVLMPLDGGEPTRHEFLAVSRHHVRVAFEDGEAS